LFDEADLRQSAVIVGQLTFSIEPIGLDWSRTIAREVKHAYARLVCHPGKGSLRGGSDRYRSDFGWRLVKT
jgi:hypothetical protein